MSGNRVILDPAPQGPDDFVLRELIGEGGTARVYRATHEVTAQEVALKIWKSPTQVLGEDAMRRFRRECQTLQTLSHRSDRIVGYVWSGLTGGFPWLAMDLCETSLARRLAEGPLPLDEALDIMDDVLIGLSEIHAAGHLHRDVQPGNVLLRAGHGVLGDFGIALDLDSWTVDLAAVTNGFVAPEVESGGLPSVRADLYSVGKTLLAALPDDLPRPLSMLLDRVTSPDPENRPSDALAMRASLAAARTTSTVTKLPLRVDAPRLSLRAGDRSCTLEPGRTCVVGRGREADLEVRDPMISRCHARVEHGPDGWRIVDLDSTNGLWHDGARVAEVVVSGPRTVRLGGAEGVPLLLEPTHEPTADATIDPTADRLPPERPEPLATLVPAAPWPPTGSRQPIGADVVPAPMTARQPRRTADSLTGRVSVIRDLPPGLVRIGRAPWNDLVLGDLMVSQQHAELRTTQDGTELRDLGSAHGTYVNGAAIHRRTLASGDLVAIGPHRLRFDGGRLVELDESSGVELTVGNLSVTLPNGRQLLQDISFRLPPRTLMAVVGSSGSGKSTLVNAIAGLRPATAGRVLYGGRDLYAEFGELRKRIGFVPQQDILHHVLTVQQALGFEARLRFPADTSAAERTERVHEVAAELSLTGQLGTRIGHLSGGERRRASTAMELLTKPAILFLDEPTSGLDADLDRDVMEQLRALADDGRTIVVVTHTLENLQACDAVMVLAPGGHLAYLGAPDGALTYFDVTSWADLFALLKTRPGVEWAEDFRRWPDRDPWSDVPVLDRSGAPPPPLPTVPRRSVISQWGTLVRRQIAVTAADRALLALLVAMPFLLALLTLVIPAMNGLNHERGNREAIELLLVLTVGAGLTGAAGSVRELVRERALFHRERAVGLSTGAYLAAKIAVLTVIAAVQGSVLTALALAWRPSPGQARVLANPILEVAVVVAATSIVSALFGLALSAAVRDESQVMPLLVVLTMAQLVMCGGLVPIDGRAGLDQLSRIIPARWGLAASASTVDLRYMTIEPNTDPLWAPTSGTWWLDIGVLAGLGVLAIWLTTLLVRWRTPSVTWAPASRFRRKGAAALEPSGFTPEFKHEVVTLYLEHRSREVLADVARESGVTVKTLRSWVKDYESTNPEEPEALTSSERARLAELELQVRELTLERELLARVAALFAKERTDVGDGGPRPPAAAPVPLKRRVER